LLLLGIADDGRDVPPEGPVNDPLQFAGVFDELRQLHQVGGLSERIAHQSDEPAPDHRSVLPVFEQLGQAQIQPPIGSALDAIAADKMASTNRQR
jgi:hypothetical protein